LQPYTLTSLPHLFHNYHLPSPLSLHPNLPIPSLPPPLPAPRLSTTATNCPPPLSHHHHLPTFSLPPSAPAPLLSFRYAQPCQISLFSPLLNKQHAGTAIIVRGTRVHCQSEILFYLQFGPLLVFYRIYMICTYFITASVEYV
jgi:hypothetical protein